MNMRSTLKKVLTEFVREAVAVIQLFSVRYRISEGELIAVLPQQLVSISEISDDFSMTFFKVDKVMFLDIISGLGKLSSCFFLLYAEEFSIPVSVTMISKGF